MNEVETRIAAKAIAKVSRKPELAHTGSGLPVCRFTVVADAGPAKSDVVMPVYVYGGPDKDARRLALNCEQLRVDQLVQVTGVQRQLVRPTKGRGATRRRETVLQGLDVRLLGPDGSPLPLSSSVSDVAMKARVVHCKKAPYSKYIGRGKCPETGEESIWFNRFSHRRSAYPEVVMVQTAEEAVACFKVDLWERFNRGEVTLEMLAELHGETLGCWCEGCCHGNVLASAAAWAYRKLAEERAAC